MLLDGAFGFTVSARIARIFSDITKQEVKKVSLFAKLAIAVVPGRPYVSALPEFINNTYLYSYIFNQKSVFVLVSAKLENRFIKRQRREVARRAIAVFGVGSQFW